MVKASSCGCGKAVAPPRPLCPHCGGATEEVEIGNTATVLSYTVLHAAPSGFEAPVRIALVEMEQGVKLMCGFSEEKDVEIGMMVKLREEGGRYYF